MRIVLDIETTFIRNGKKSNPSPYEKDNKLVSVGIKNVDTGSTGYYFFHHKQNTQDVALNTKLIQKTLTDATLVIGHNLKFDMSWLFECGFTYEGKYWDTMHYEYVCAKGLKPALSLEACANKYGLPPKLDWFKAQMEAGLNTDEMDMEGLTTYGLQDIDTTEALYKYQQESIQNSTETQSMLPAIDLMNDTLPVIIEMERNGCYIDRAVLAEVEKEYREEYAVLQSRIQNQIVDVMGDTPININSSEQLSWVIYSRKVKDKDKWIETFDIGAEERNSVKKAKRIRKLKPYHLRNIVMTQMETLYRTEAFQCDTCYGKGKIRKVKQNGEPFAKEHSCKSCEGSGFTYTNSDKIAGFKLQPIDSTYVSQGGFSTDKDTLEELLKRPKLKQEAREFITDIIRINAIETYLSTFIEGIKKHVKEDSILHTNLNMCITATGRLSSTNPNFHNLPRAKTFPVRKSIRSRHGDGKILEVDWSALEYRTAVLLSKDKAGIESILQGKDRHAITRDILCASGQQVDRQDAKPHTFKPLYGGQSGTEAEQAYYRAFKEEHKELSAWQKSLATTAIQAKQIQSPSGRIYAFPFARRVSADYVNGQTQIYNYLIQGFATGDIMPAVLVDIYHNMKEIGVKSKLILTVHDSVEIDVYPGEENLMLGLVSAAFGGIEETLKKRFNFECCVPLAFEIKMGDNWMETKEIKYAA